MIGKISMSALVLVLAANLLQSTYGATYTVGDSTGWTIPFGNKDLYDDWADNKNFVVGDVLVFGFTTGQHNVAEVTEAAYDACSVTNPISTLRTGPARITLNRTGEHYFICAFPGHCSAGQKLSVEVEVRNGTHNNTAPSLKPSPSPTVHGASSPTPTMPATPHSASTAGATSTTSGSTPETPTATAPGHSGTTPGTNSASSLGATLSTFFFMSVALVLLLS